jgi:hypothetical protein
MMIATLYGTVVTAQLRMEAMNQDDKLLLFFSLLGNGGCETVRVETVVGVCVACGVGLLDWRMTV